MKSFLSIGLAIFSLLLIAGSTTESRVLGPKIGAGQYWKKIMKDQPMPEAIKGLLIGNSDEVSTLKDDNDKFTDEFEPNSGIRSVIYHKKNDQTENFEPTKVNNDNGFTDKFEPNSGIRSVIYHRKNDHSENFEPTKENNNEEFTDEFEPNSGIRSVIYHKENDQTENFEPTKVSNHKEFTDKFEPNSGIRSVIYHRKNDQSENFEPTKGNNDEEFTDEFEPNSGIRAVIYRQNDDKKFTDEFEPNSGIALCITIERVIKPNTQIFVLCFTIKKIYQTENSESTKEHNNKEFSDEFRAVLYRRVRGQTKPGPSVLDVLFYPKKGL